MLSCTVSLGALERSDHAGGLDLCTIRTSNLVCSCTRGGVTVTLDGLEVALVVAIVVASSAMVVSAPSLMSQLVLSVLVERV